MTNLIKKGFFYLPYIPCILFKLKNPHIYIYSLVRNISTQIKFKNRLVLNIFSKDDSSSISVIFFKKEYGNIERHINIVDIGANRGYFSLYAAWNKNTTVLAYEPIESTYLSLLDNISLNNCKNIKAFNFGIAGKSEVKTFNYSKEASILSSMILNVKNEKKIKIKCITLEDIITDNKLENIDLLKIDCEGAEFEIFYSTKKEYLQKIKEIRMEYHNFEKQGCNITELTKFLENNNFYLVKKVEANCDLGIAWFVNGEAR